MISPVIVLGVARSGTSMIAKIIRELGVDMGGWHGDAHTENGWVKEINESILKKHNNSRWFELPEIDMNLIPEEIEQILSYIDSKNKVGNNWGFKDLRSVITFPVWQKCLNEKFTVVIINRSTDSVANNFMYGVNHRLIFNKVKARQLVTAHKKKVLEIIDGLGPEIRVVDFTYRKIIRHPATEIKRLAEFLDIPVTPAALNVVDKTKDHYGKSI